jgi:drug/metabolite transporter (DMT)-like permease
MAVEPVQGFAMSPAERAEGLAPSAYSGWRTRIEQRVYKGDLMSKVDVAALIALCAALASAVGDVIRQRSAHEITDKEVGHLELFRMSLRDKRWWIGGLAAIANYSLQACALIWGSVVLVTALQVTALLFALPINARLTHQRVTRWEWIWAVVLAAALAVVIVVGDPKSGHERASLSSWLVVAAVMGPTLVLCVLAARIWSGRPVAAVLLALVSGASLALFAVLTKGVVEVGESGLGAVLRMPEFVPWLLVALCGMIFQQSAFRAGALTASLPTMRCASPWSPVCWVSRCSARRSAPKAPRRSPWSWGWPW